MTTWTEVSEASTTWTEDQPPIFEQTIWDDGATIWDAGATLWDVDRTTEWTAIAEPSTTWTSL